MSQLAQFLQLFELSRTNIKCMSKKTTTGKEENKVFQFSIMNKSAAGYYIYIPRRTFQETANATHVEFRQHQGNQYLRFGNNTIDGFKLSFNASHPGTASLHNKALVFIILKGLGREKAEHVNLVYSRDAKIIDGEKYYKFNIE